MVMRRHCPAANFPEEIQGRRYTEKRRGIAGAGSIELSRETFAQAPGDDCRVQILLYPWVGPQHAATPRGVQPFVQISAIPVRAVTGDIQISRAWRMGAIDQDLGTCVVAQGDQSL